MRKANSGPYANWLWYNHLWWNTTKVVAEPQVEEYQLIKSRTIWSSESWYSACGGNRDVFYDWDWEEMISLVLTIPVLFLHSGNPFFYWRHGIAVPKYLGKRNMRYVVNRYSNWNRVSFTALANTIFPEFASRGVSCLMCIRTTTLPRSD